MVRKRKTTASSGEAAARVAEGIGEALARVVNRLESLDAEREKAYGQLVELQRRVNTQVTRFGRAFGRKVSSAESELGGRPRKTVKQAKTTVRKARRAATKRKRSAGKTKTTIKCGICGTRGHNARGHAKWEASRRR